MQLKIWKTVNVHCETRKTRTMVMKSHTSPGLFEYEPRISLTMPAIVSIIFSYFLSLGTHTHE